jgi:SAM-dependent methyltransferase
MVSSVDSRVVPSAPASRARMDAVTTERPADLPPRELGNLDANLRFLEQTGVLASNPDLLEIGSGTGALLHVLRQRGVKACGVELRPEFIEQARVWYGDLPLTRVTGVGLPFPDRSFDVVMSFDVFEHISESDAHLREVTRVLRPGGAYLIQTPNKWANTVFETIRWRSFTAWRADHCSLQTLSSLQHRLARHGFAMRAYDVPVVNDFFRRKVRRYAGWPGSLALRLVNPDRFPLRFRTNLYVQATLHSGPGEHGSP